jgi:hypothetical protein
MVQQKPAHLATQIHHLKTVSLKSNPRHLEDERVSPGLSALRTDSRLLDSSKATHFSHPPYSLSLHAALRRRLHRSSSKVGHLGPELRFGPRTPQSQPSGSDRIVQILLPDSVGTAVE